MLLARGLGRSFPAVPGRGAGVMLFKGLDLAVNAGEMVAIIGRSGSGKSSLLHLLAGLDRPDAGEVRVAGQLLGALSDDALARVRNRQLGFVWQFHHLLPEFSAQENIALPLRAGGVPGKEAMARALDALEQVELRDRAGHRPGELSGGEQQRVALARALVTRPRVLLADEPTGDLDDETAAHLFGLLRHISRQEELAVVLVTHNGELAARCDRALRLGEGRLQAL